MKPFIKETNQIIKLNGRQVLLFELFYRVVTLPLYLKLLNQGLQFSLKMTGYSYVTVGNIWNFLFQPWTILCMTGIALLGILFLSIEIGGLITAFQGVAYGERVSFFMMFAGGVEKLSDEIRRRNWKLFLLILVDYTLTHAYLIYRMFTHVKPLNFVMKSILEEPVSQVPLILAFIGFIVLAVPSMFVFHGCMIEQKSFRDSLNRSRNLLKGHYLQAVCSVVGYNVLINLGLVCLYFVCVLSAALFILAGSNQSAVLAVLLSVGDRLELILIFIASILVVVVNFATLTVLYFQYHNRILHDTPWDFSFSRATRRSRRVFLFSTAVVVGLGLFYIYDLVRNGSALVSQVLVETSITAHRGSSKSAPENTMAAIEAAVADLADYVEIDVQLSSDGIVILCHDGNLKRVAGISKSVHSMTWEELQNLDVGSWFSKDFKGEKIPSLEEVMKFCKGKISLNIELKNTGKSTELADKVLELVELYGMQQQCVVTSTSLSYLMRVKEVNPDIHTGFIVSAAYGNYYSNEAVDFISLRSSFVTEGLLRAAHEQGKKIHVWTVNEKSEMERMRMLGVDNVITDYPVLARAVLYQEEGTENLLEYLRLIFR